MNDEDREELCRALSVFIKEQVDCAIEKRMKEFKFVGAHEPEMKYVTGNFVVKGGSLWHCRADTKINPGETDCWVLVAKRGNDGRDANRVPTRSAQRTG